MGGILALDIGARRTGVAFADPSIGIAHPRTTLMHASDTDLVESICALVAAEDISEVVVGLPLLPSGAEGAQAACVRAVVDRLSAEHIPCHLLDERYTTPRSGSSDSDAAAACALLETWISRRSRIDK